MIENVQTNDIMQEEAEGHPITLTIASSHTRTRQTLLMDYTNHLSYTASQ